MRTRWLEDAVSRHAASLSARELHRGVRALSARYVERRGEAGLARRALEGAGKRAAFATYYAALHVLTLEAVLDTLGLGWARGVSRVIDGGAGTGVVGARLAQALDPPVRLLAIDRSGWALAEARHSFAAFGVRGQTRRGRLPQALPRLGRGDLVLLAWVANELEPPEREQLLTRLERGLRAGARLLLLEPLAGPAAPWLPDWAAQLAPHGIAERELKQAVTLPAFVARIDRATGLRHATLGARVLYGPKS